MDLYDTAVKLLDLVTTQLQAQGIAVPTRVYVAPGAEIAYDCDQLTINLSRVISNAQGSDTPVPVVTHKLILKSAEYYINLCRCVPTLNEDGSAPSPQKLNDAAALTMADVVGLRRALEQIEHQHLLVPRNVPVTIGQVTSIGPLGGIVGAQAVYTVMLVDNNGWAG